MSAGVPATARQIGGAVARLLAVVNTTSLRLGARPQFDAVLNNGAMGNITP